jgi:hypothetical protein
MLRTIAFALILFPTIALASPFGDYGSNATDKKADKLMIGAEINPISFIASSDSRVYFNAGISLFNRQNSTEIAIPLDYKNIQSNGDQFTALSLSAHYRKFLTKGIEGYYFSGVSRLVTINSDTTKIGLGFGIGYRRHFNSGLYWGYGLILGRYLGDNDQFESEDINSFDTIEDKSIMVDIELLKVGMMF